MELALVGCRAVSTWPIAPTAQDPRPWERDDRALHTALRALGATVHSPAWDDPEVDWSVYDRVVPRATWDYHHRRDAFVSWAERVGSVTRLDNPAAILRWNTDKHYLRELDVPQPPTVWLARGSAPDLGSILEERGWSQGFLKPAIGATAAGTIRFSARTLPEAEALLAERLGQVEYLLQPYLDVVETAGERSAIAIGGQITHCVSKHPVPGDYRVQDDWGGTDRPHAPTPAEVALAERALAAVGTPLAYARVDWLPTADGPKLVELELVEPCLFFRHGPGAAEALARVLMAG